MRLRLLFVCVMSLPMSSQQSPRPLLPQGLWANIIAGLALLVLLTNSAFSAVVNFGSATTITSDSEVLTAGSLKCAYGFGTAQTVNGVTFTQLALTGNAEVGISGLGSTYDGYGSPGAYFNVLGAGYQALLGKGNYNGGAQATLTLNGLTVGRTYAIQLWAHDGRDKIASGYATEATRDTKVYSTGGNSATLRFNVQGGAGATGQFTIGTFVADSTSQQVLIVQGGGSTSPATQINAIQVRDVTTVVGIWSGAVNGNFDATTANWAGFFSKFSLMPAGQSFTFGDTNGSGVTVPNTNVTVAASGINLSGGTLVFTNSALNYTLSPAGTLGLSGSAGLNKAGPGQLTISSPNTLTGPTVLSAGTILAGASGAIPSGALTISAGAALDLKGFSQTVGVLTNNGTLTNTGSLATLNMASMAGSSTVLSGPLNLGFSNASSYAGALDVNIASLSNLSATTTLDATAATIQIGSLGKTFAGNAGFNVKGIVSGTGDLVVQANGSGLVFVDGDLNFNGTVTNNGIGTTGTHSGAGASSGTITLGTMNARATRGTAFLSGEIGAGVTKVIQDSPTSALCLYANNTAWSGTVEIRRGALILTNYAGFTPNVAGKGTIIVGTGAADAAFMYQADFSPQPPTGLGSTGGDLTFSNPLLIAGSGKNVVGNMFWSMTLTGTISLSGADVTFANTNPQASDAMLTLSGGIVGDGDVFATTSTGSGGSRFVFDTNPVNHTGKITFNSGSVLGAFPGTNTTKTNQILGGVGSNVTEVLQDSDYSPLAISTGSVNVGVQGLSLSSDGAALMTVSSAIQGTGKLTVNIKSSGGITLSGAVSNQGGLELNRTGSGAFTYTGAGTYSSITHSSTASAWTLSSGAITVPSTGSTFRSSATSAFTISSALNGSGLITLDADSSGVMALSGAITASGSLVNSGTGTLTVGTFYTTAATGSSAVVLRSSLGTSVSRVIQDSAYSPLVIYASNTLLNAPFEIRQGALVVSSTSSLSKQLGNGSILLGTGSADAALVAAGRYANSPAVAGSDMTLANPVTVGGFGKNVIIATDYALTLSGAVNLTSDLTISTGNNMGSVVTLSG